ncbi:MAG TPA: alpha/beta hydrolase [Micromonosporaceae bacterium]|nr:alpha/beta hydrolase [Micromonosporaceae bacterium]
MELTARGLTFTVRSGGPADGPVVLLLHGFPQHGGEWDAVVPALRQAGLRTIAPDQRGYTPGARPPDVADYALDECVADALAIMDAVGADRFHVVGHDWGAVVAWLLAVDHPERVRTLTALSVPHPVAMTRAIRHDAGQKARSAYIALFRQKGIAEKVLLAADAAALRRAFAGSGLDRPGVERYVAPLRAPGALTAALNWYRAVDIGAFPTAGPVTVPTTFLWSDGDVAIGRVAADGCAEFVTGEYRFVPLAGVSHWIVDQVPDVVVAEVLSRVNRATEG